MGRLLRRGKKRKGRQSERFQSQARSSFRTTGRVAIGVGLSAICLVAILAWTAPRLFRSAELPCRTAPSISIPPAPPVDPVAVLGVNAAIPNDAEGLRHEVVTVCEELVRKLPNRPEAYSVVALTRYRYGLKDEAFEAWRQAKILNEQFSPAYVGMGLVSADKERNDAAIEALRRAIELNPSTEEAYAKLVEVLLRVNKAEEALTVAGKFTRLFPRSRKATYWLGQTYLQLERYEEAVSAHEMVIRQHPDLTPSYYSLATAHARLGHREDSAAARKKFAELKEKDLERQRAQNRNYVDASQQRTILVDTHLSAGNVFMHAADPIKAEAHWLRGLQVCGENVPCRQALATLYHSQERWLSASAVLGELAELTPDDPDVWLQLAGVLERLGKTNDAEASYRQAIAVAPESASGYIGMLRLGLQTNRRMHDGVSLARKAVELAPSPDSYLLLSTVLEESGDRKGALTAIEKAIELAPTAPQLQRVYQQLQKGG